MSYKSLAAVLDIDFFPKVVPWNISLSRGRSTRLHPDKKIRLDRLVVMSESLKITPRVVERKSYTSRGLLLHAAHSLAAAFIEKSIQTNVLNEISIYFPFPVD